MVKDNPFSDNPFQATPDVNPFTEAAPRYGAATQGVYGNDVPAATSSRVHDDDVPAVVTIDKKADKKSSGKSGQSYDELLRKEAELNAREKELKRREDELRRAGGGRPEKNWPICYPITHHDIAGEVPADSQRVVRKGYYSFLGLMVCLTFNWFGALIAMCAINPGDGRLAGFFLATIYWLAGVPGAWILWYMRLYHAAIKDRAFTYAWFFLLYLVHIAFCLWSAIAPPLPMTNDWSHTGYIVCLKAFDKNTFTGVIYVIGAVLWTMESLWSFWTLKSVYSSFRGSGGDKLKREMAVAAANHAASQGRV
ncbi:hypothetical protein WJX72_004131 [[Myrmecia] bisecta]|uniref:Secretory carrier-associated membrane protein n=1 Tax=[Myrmecia] bisecta TaxID=41462 RepID=A0AAW1QFE3_9CHLO